MGTEPVSPEYRSWDIVFAKANALVKCITYEYLNKISIENRSGSNFIIFRISIQFCKKKFCRIARVSTKPEERRSKRSQADGEA